MADDPFARLLGESRTSMKATGSASLSSRQLGPSTFHHGEERGEPALDQAEKSLSAMDQDTLTNEALLSDRDKLAHDPDSQNSHVSKRKASPSNGFGQLLNSSRPKRSLENVDSTAAVAAAAITPRGQTLTFKAGMCPFKKGSEAKEPVIRPTQNYSPTRPNTSRLQSTHLAKPFSIRRPSSAMAFVPPWATQDKVKFLVRNFPPDFRTRQIYASLPESSKIICIDIENPERRDQVNAFVTYSPVPRNAFGLEQISKGLRIKERLIIFDEKPLRSPNVPSPIDPRHTFPEVITIEGQEVDIGVMKGRKTLLALHTVRPLSLAAITISINLQRKVLDIDFPIGRAGGPRLFKIRLLFSQLSKIFRLENRSMGLQALIIPIQLPPQVFRKSLEPLETHEHGSTYWTDWQMFYRQTEIDDRENPQEATQLASKSTTVIDIGRWTAYAVYITEETARHPQFREMLQALHEHNVTIESHDAIGIEKGNGQQLWSWLEDYSAATEPSLVSSELQQLASGTISLPFQVRYQLEVCISQGALHESNIDPAFLQILADMEPARAAKLLEKTADEKERFYNPHTIFTRLSPTVSIAPKQRPSYCAMVRTATVTPTTVYFTSPAFETSNRVIRHYSQYEDRFLRVKFTDEKYRGRLMGGEPSLVQPITHVYNTMKHGIKVGGRHYEILAFGNSQFREHGAYFFSPTPNLTTHNIRDWMGDFSDITVVAKYCSRLGQCFSTTRALPIRVNVEKIQDIQRNGFCFSDGVGKLAPFLARMIAHEWRLPNSDHDYPSVFQFRLGGCKGVLTVDPALKGNTMQIRPSQDKFPSIQNTGLEIIRISQFTNAFLNVQLILVLSALGVIDEHFISKMRKILIDLREAMTDEPKALTLLMKNIDFNGMTVQLAAMLLDGFMATQDPFTISCLRLWRAWSIKYLKEKARILVEQGAFVLGCVDETGTLKGHSNAAVSSDEQHDVGSLPEIFLQIPDLEEDGNWKVVEGICAVARNPSLHPGDIRMVKAVKNDKLLHLKNCVVFPQRGDRDLANMCSGGDLDGDDYIVIWDKNLLPREWNHEPMDYTPPPPEVSDHPVDVTAMIQFFVTHMKYDNLARIAVAHRYWADREDDGVKDEKCIELAHLHSRAVDYAKTGVPAEMGKHLRVAMWPHWSQPKNKPKHKVYTSRKIIGQLYDEVERVPFVPAWDLPFDKRILDAFTLTDELLAGAREVKQSYDRAVQRVMNKFGIGSEFEVWSTFVLEHSDDVGDYKFAETIGEAVSAIKEHHQRLCYEKADTTDKERDWSKMGPFIAAMYTVTAEEITAANAKADNWEVLDGHWQRNEQRTFKTMPFMSFPWIFPAELGRIATKEADSPPVVTDRTIASRIFARKKRSKTPKEEKFEALMRDVPKPEPLPEVKLPDKHNNGVNMLGLRDYDHTPDFDPIVDAPAIRDSDTKFEAPSPSQQSIVSLFDKATLSETHQPMVNTPLSTSPESASPQALDLERFEGVGDEVVSGQNDGSMLVEAKQDQGREEEEEEEEEDEEEVEEVILEGVDQPSALDALERLMAM